MPNPNSPDYPERVAEVAFPLIRAAQGRTFVLGTSLRAMRRIHELLAERIAREGPSAADTAAGEARAANCWPASAGSAMRCWWRARVSGRVDVPGDALSVVVIDKLPFAPPDDPVLAARVDYLEKKGPILSSFTSCRAP